MPLCKWSVPVSYCCWSSLQCRDPHHDARSNCKLGRSCSVASALGDAHLFTELAASVPRVVRTVTCHSRSSTVSRHTSQTSRNLAIRSGPHGSKPIRFLMNFLGVVSRFLINFLGIIEFCFILLLGIIIIIMKLVCFHHEPSL